MAKQVRIRESITTPLSDAERFSTSMSLPSPVLHHLNELALVAGAARPSRAELIAMLIVETTPDAEELERRLLAYRKLKVGDVVTPASGTTVEFKRRKPGRPRQEISG